MKAWNRRALAVALLCAAWLSLLTGIPGAPNGQGFVSAAHAEPAVIRRLIEWLRGMRMPAGIVKAEGRIEAAQIDVSSKYAGVLAEVAVWEGEKVAKGQVIAMVKSPALEAGLQAAQAKLQSAKEARAENDIKAAQAKVDEIKAMISDLTLVAPREGKVEAQLAHAGDAIAAGAAIVTLIDLTDVYMTVFVHSADAAKLVLGDQARLILDAAPDYVVPATVGFVASNPPGSSKAAEPKEELAKEMFRVDLKVDPTVLQTYYAKVETGLTGAGFVRTSADAKWPADLQVKLPPAPVVQEPSSAPAPVAQADASPSAPPGGPMAASAPAAAPTSTPDAAPTPAPAPAPVEAAAPAQKAAPALPPASAPAPLQVEASTSAPVAPEAMPTPPPPPVSAPPSPPAPAHAPAAQASAGLGYEEPAGEVAPESLAQLRGAWAQSTDDCKKIFQRRGAALAYRQPVDKFAQAMIIESQRIRLPTGVCRLERASREGGALRVSGECQDSISYTSQTTYVKLRSKNEILFNPNGDPALNTSLMRCSV